MQKWNHGFLSRKLEKMSDERGFTLVELLATLALLSIVISLVGSVLLYGMKQYDRQTDSAGQSNDYTYSMALLSKEIRKAGKVTTTGDSITIDETLVFSHVGTQLIENDNRVIAEDVKKASFELIDNKNVKIKLISNTGKEYQTTIHMRR